MPVVCQRKVFVLTQCNVGKLPLSALIGGIPHVPAHVTGGQLWWYPGLPDEHSSAVASALPLPSAPEGCHLRNRVEAAAKLPYR